MTHCRSTAEKFVMYADGSALCRAAASVANSAQVVGGVMWYFASRALL
jgi:hypothetical protein